MVNKIEIKNLKLHAFHGVLPQERVVGNLYAVNLSVETDFSQAMMSDNLADTINYATLALIVKEEMAQPSQLIEHVGGRIVQRIQDQWGSRIEHIDLIIEKLTPPIELDIEAASVRIII